MAVIRTGLIGYGMAGRVFHAPLISTTPGLQLSAVASSGGAAALAYPHAVIYPTPEALLADTRIELVVLAVPNPLHAPLAAAALAAGKHVIVDKPLAVSSTEARNLISSAGAADRLVIPFHNRRWDGDFRTVQQLIADGALGRIVSVESHFDRFRPARRPGAWREQAEPGSGILYDLAPHLIDQALVLFGPPQAVDAIVGVDRDDAVIDDHFRMTLHYPRLTVTLGASMLARLPRPRFTLHGTAGSYVKHGLDPQEAALRDGQRPPDAGWGREPSDQWGTLSFVRGDLPFNGRIETLAGDYTAFYRAVVAAVRTSADVPVSATAALNGLIIIETALTAARLGQRLPLHLKL